MKRPGPRPARRDSRVQARSAPRRPLPRPEALRPTAAAGPRLGGRPGSYLWPPRREAARGRPREPFCVPLGPPVGAEAPAPRGSLRAASGWRARPPRCRRGRGAGGDGERLGRREAKGPSRRSLGEDGRGSASTPPSHSAPARAASASAPLPPARDGAPALTSRRTRGPPRRRRRRRGSVRALARGVFMLG